MKRAQQLGALVQFVVAAAASGDEFHGAFNPEDGGVQPECPAGHKPDMSNSNPAATEPTATRKVVLNTDCGSYRLSAEAHLALQGSGGTNPEALPRDHPALVAVVERLGDAAGGPVQDRLNSWGVARLRVAVIPSECDWLIEDHDGAEWIVVGTRWTEQGQVPDDEREPWQRTEDDVAADRQIAPPTDRDAP